MEYLTGSCEALRDLTDSFDREWAWRIERSALCPKDL